jgi:aromatic ring-opening dioxygenase catalytic subunit (LigB family)
MQAATVLPTLYIPHGGGPCFFIDSPPEFARAWDGLGSWLRALPSTLDVQPGAIVVVSAHWEAGVPTVTAAAAPPLIYDYSGFPPHTYELEYPAPGSPELATRIVRLLEASGIAAAADPRRGFDPALHLAIGRALTPLRSEGVLIVGSGMSFHNMSALRGATPPAGAATFDRWLRATVEAEPAAREARLVAWRHAPDARLAHPREEHLIPLLVAAGAAGNDAGVCVFGERILGCEISGFRFG